MQRDPFGVHSDPFWVNDLQLLFRLDRIIEFYPSLDMTANERINAITRFVIYAGFCISFVKKNMKPLAISLTIVALLAYLYYPKADKQMLDDYYDNKNTNENVHNPFMNLLPLDPKYSSKKNQKSAKYNGQYENTYQNDDDFYNSNNGKQFNTVPSHTSDDHLQFLFQGNMGSCKNGENQESCYR